MARVEGFEPPNIGTKNRGLTTWRHPNVVFSYFSVPKYYTLLEVNAQALGVSKQYFIFELHL